MGRGEDNEMAARIQAIAHPLGASLGHPSGVRHPRRRLDLLPEPAAGGVVKRGLKKHIDNPWADLVLKS